MTISKVLLIQDSKYKTQELRLALEGSHYSIEHVSNAGIDLLEQVNKLQPDVLIIDVDAPEESLVDSLNQLAHTTPKPIVMFSEQQDTNTINMLVKSGVNAYVVGDVNPIRVKSILDTAIARFTEYQNLKDELAATQRKLSNQKTVEQAKIWLMETKRISEKEAYHSIRRMAMDNSQKIEDVAKNILSLAQVLEAQT